MKKRRKTTAKTALAKRLKQARQAEIKAIQKLTTIVKRNQLALAKMRRTIKQKIAEKVRAAAKIRAKLVKGHQQRVAKLKREYLAEIAKLKKELTKKHGKKTSKTIKATKRRKTTSRRRKSSKAKVVPFRTVSRSSHLRRVA